MESEVLLSPSVLNRQQKRRRDVPSGLEERLSPFLRRKKARPNNDKTPNTLLDD